MTADLAAQIADAQKTGFVPGASYRRDDGVIMVEITPGNFVNARVAQSLGVKPSNETADDA